MITTLILAASLTQATVDVARHAPEKKLTVTQRNNLVTRVQALWPGVQLREIIYLDWDVQDDGSTQACLDIDRPPTKAEVVAYLRGQADVPPNPRHWCLTLSVLDTDRLYTLVASVFPETADRIVTRGRFR